MHLVIGDRMEYGLAAWKAILGLELLNEGGGLSVDDITNEEQSTYVARAATAWVPWTPTGITDPATGQFLNSDGGNTEGPTNVQPFGAGTIQDYANWLGITGGTP